MIDSPLLGVVHSLLQTSVTLESRGLLSYTDPLIFAIPVALVVIVTVIVISASSITKQQNRIRNEDRLLDTLERIRRENQEPHTADRDLDEAMRQLVKAKEEVAAEDRAVADAVEVSAPDTGDAAGEAAQAKSSEESKHELSRYDYEDELDDFEEDEEDDQVPEGVICDEDGFCYAPSLNPELVAQAKAQMEAQEQALPEAEEALEAESEDEETEEETPAPDLEPEKPEPKLSRLQRLKTRLAGRGGLGKAMVKLLSRAEISSEDWQELEDTLLAADLGIDPTTELIEKLQTQQKIEGTTDPERVRQMAKEQLLQLLDPQLDRELHLEDPEGGATGGLLMVGVNGAGKTTTVGKMARFLVAEGKTVVLGAADTFRAAAGEQLQTWGDRVGVSVVRSEKDKADPASVAFDAAKLASESGADVVLIDTAGRLQNKSTLMDELGKIKRVAQKQVPITEVLLVIDATTGQNALSQAKVFTEAVGVTGIVLTKLDGSAKGGIVVSVQRELGLPVKFVGLGEGPDDLAPFVAADFVDALLEA